METIKLCQATATGTQSIFAIGGSRNPSGSNTGAVQVIGGTAAAITLEGSMDGVNFMDIATGLTPTASKSVSVWPWVRANVTGVGSPSTIAYVTF
jgi:hypothetical protein